MWNVATNGQVKVMHKPRFNFLANPLACITQKTFLMELEQKGFITMQRNWPQNSLPPEHISIRSNKERRQQVLEQPVSLKYVGRHAL